MGKITYLTDSRESVARLLIVGFVFLLATNLPGSFCGGRAPLAQETDMQLELAVDPRLPPLTQHEWARELARLGITGVRIRMAFPTDQPRVETIQTEPITRYRVLGVVDHTNQLLLPGARFSIRQLNGLVNWLDELRRDGPPSERPKPVAFGLDVVQFQLLKQQLAAPVTFSLKGQTVAQAVGRLAEQLATPVTWEPRTRERLSQDPVNEELQGLALGTSLAYLLRYDGLILLPRRESTGIRLLITRGSPNLAGWPVGWTPEEGETTVLPRLLESLTVNIENVSIKVVLSSLESRLGVVSLFDHPALARFGIDLEKTSIKIPQAKTTYSQILRRSLFQAGLKGEVRLDDADRPFIWITTLRPVEVKP